MNRVQLVPAWLRDEAKLHQDAIAFWTKLGSLPEDTTAEERAKELCVIAYLGEEVVGVSTAYVGPLPPLRCTFAFFRCLVAPGHRLHDVARQLAVSSKHLLAEWSVRAPEARVKGMAAIIQSPMLMAIADQPIWPSSRLALVGYTSDGCQVRVAWFDHARLDGVALPSTVGDARALQNQRE